MKLANFARLLLVTSALAAYAHYCQSARPRSSGAPAAANPATVAAIPLLRRADAEGLWKDSGTVFLDVRSRTDYEYGHIAGAINLPDEEFEQEFPALRSRLERARAIVVYCKSEDCGKSLWSAIRLRNEGLLQARIYPYGWNEWSEAGLPVIRGGR